MSDTAPLKGGLEQPTPEQMTSALFASMVVQQANMALMLLGKVPHPETGEVMHELEAARTFIDQLEMLEIKTKGNLDPRESQLLKQSLTTLHMAFVEAAASPTSGQAKAAFTAAADVPGKSTAAPGETSASAPADAGSTPPEEESRKKFSKKY